MRSEQPENGKGVSALESLVRRKVVLLRKYLSVTEEMKASPETVNPDTLNSLLGRRQKCAEDIERTDAAFREIVRETCGERAAIPSEVRSLLGRHVHQIRDILSRIEAMDQELTGRLEKAAETARGELLRMRSVRGAMKEYRRPAFREPRFMDVNR